MTEVNLGATMRRLREERGLTLRSLAARTGFSASFISQVENGQASPSVASTERLAAALGVTLSEFFQGAESAPTVVRTDARPQLTSGWSKARIEALGGGRGAGMDPVIVTIDAGGMSGKRTYPAAREEFALVLDGRVHLTLGESEHLLETGDAVAIPAGAQRRWYNRDGAPARLLLVSRR